MQTSASGTGTDFMAIKPLNLNPRGAAPSDAVADASAVPASDAASPARPDFRKRALPVVAGLAALAVLWFGGSWLINGRFEIKTDNAYIRATITTVAAKVQGYVQSVPVIENQRVKAGDLLFTLEADDYRAKYAEAKAALAQAEADAVQAKARIAAQQAAVSSARSRSSAQKDQLAEAVANEQAAAATSSWQTSDLKRLSDLADKGWYPKARVEQAQAAERAAAAQQKQAQAAITAQKSQLASSESGIGQAQQELSAAAASAASGDARVEAARARLEAAELDLKRTEVRAPIDGVVANKTIAEGQLLSPGQIALSIVPADDAYVVANFKETQVQRMKPGQRVYIHVDAYPDLKVMGRVQSIAPATGATFSLIPQDTATGNFTKIVQRVPVRVALDKEAIATGLMRSGLAVVATVTTKESEAAPPPK